MRCHNHGFLFVLFGARNDNPAWRRGFPNKRSKGALGSFTVFCTHQAEDDGMGSTVEVHKPQRDQVYKIGREQIGNLGISEYSPTGQDIEREQRYRSSCNNHNKHNYSFLSDLQCVRADLYRAGSIKVSFFIAGSTVL